jgi:hypothetical protein
MTNYLLAFILLLAPLCNLQAQILLPILAGKSASAPAAITLINHSTANGTDTFSTTGVDTTGANFLAVALDYFDSAPPALTDSATGCASPCNTWTALTKSGPDAAAGSTIIYYACNATVGANHVFTATRTGQQATLTMEAFSNVKTTTCFESENGAIGALVSTLQGGSVTPAASGDLVIAAIQPGNSTTLSIDSGFTITDFIVSSGGVSYAGGMAYLVVSSTAAQNPTWTMSNSTNETAANAVFSK